MSEFGPIEPARWLMDRYRGVAAAQRMSIVPRTGPEANLTRENIPRTRLFLQAASG
ncbi:MAG: hypothetical protein AAFV87_14010 [Pseudomonadota bacterium]